MTEQQRTTANAIGRPTIWTAFLLGGLTCALFAVWSEDRNAAAIPGIALRLFVSASLPIRFRTADKAGVLWVAVNCIGLVVWTATPCPTGLVYFICGPILGKLAVESKGLVLVGPPVLIDAIFWMAVFGIFAKTYRRPPSSIADPAKPTSPRS